ncbi:MAG: MOSC domain-containing protein [Dehalococcoidia bacterium]
MSTDLGSVAAIWRFPMKSAMGESLNASLVTARGIAGDRAYALVDTDGRISTAKIPRKWGALYSSRARYLTEPADDDLPPAEITFPDGERMMTSAPGFEARMAELVGREVKVITERPEKLLLESPRLGKVPEGDDEPTIDFPVLNGFFDLGSLHLLTTATLSRLRSLSPDTRFEPRRFRPNIVVETPPGAEGFVENEWPGKVLAIGDDVRIKVTMPTIRCVVTTLAQDDLPNEPAVLKTAAQHNSANVGVYAMVERGGMIRRGDRITIVD